MENGNPVARKTWGQIVDEQGTPTILAAIIDLHNVRGMVSIKEQPGRIARYPIDENWYAAIHGNEEETELAPEGGAHDGGMRVIVPRWTLAVWWRGWLAGVIDPGGGEFATHPESDGANEDHFIRAIEAAIAKEFEA